MAGSGNRIAHGGYTPSLPTPPPQSPPDQPILLEHEEDIQDTKADHNEHDADEHGHITTNEDTGDQEEQ